VNVKGRIVLVPILCKGKKKSLAYMRSRIFVVFFSTFLSFFLFFYSFALLFTYKIMNNLSLVKCLVIRMRAKTIIISINVCQLLVLRIKTVDTIDAFAHVMYLRITDTLYNI